MSAVAYIVVFISAAAVNNISSLEIIPERSAILYSNDKYVADVKTYVKRYSRRGKYFLNIEGTTKHTWANNVSLHVLTYEYLHNEYKRSFVEMHFKVCDLINKDPYIGKAVANLGITCPMLPGRKLLHNMTFPMDNFPYVWPFERCKLDVQLKLVSPEELIVRGEVYIFFKQKVGK